MINQFKYSFNFILDNNDITPLLSGLKSLTLNSSIYSLYPTATMEIYLPSNLIETGILSIGSEAIFEFFETNTKFIKKYKVWKIKCNSSESTRAMAGIYTITFIDQWYFNQEAKCKAYYGSSMVVLMQMLTDEYYTEFSGYYIDKSLDAASKHYRTYQTSGLFIEDRIYDKYLVDNSPSFIYVNDNREFHAHSFLSMLNTKKQNIAVDTRNVDLDTSLTSTSISLNRLLVPMSFNYSLNDSGSLWYRINTKTSLLYPTHDSKPLSTISGNTSLFGSSGFYPVHSSIKNNTVPLSVYLNDSENSLENIYTSFLIKQKDILLDQMFTLTTAPNFVINIGEAIDLYLKKDIDRSVVDADANSVFCATYLITGIRHIMIGDKFISQFSLVRDIIKPISSTSLEPNTSSLII